MCINDRRLSEGVGINFTVGMYDPRTILKESIAWRTVFGLFTLAKQFFRFGQILFCCIIKSLPTSVPAYSVNRLLGNRTTETKLLFSINALRIGSFFGLFKTPCEVMKACKPPSRSISFPFRKK